MDKDLFFRFGKFLFRIAFILLVLLSASCLTAGQNSAVQSAISESINLDTTPLYEIALQSSEIEFAELMDKEHLLLQCSRVTGFMQTWGVFRHEIILVDPSQGKIRWRMTNKELLSSLEECFYDAASLYISGWDYEENLQRLSCLNRDDGSILWFRNDPRHFRYTFHKEKGIILARGGDKENYRIMALSPETGEELWNITLETSFAFETYPETVILPKEESCLVFGKRVIDLSLNDGRILQELELKQRADAGPKVWGTETGILVVLENSLALLSREGNEGLWFKDYRNSLITTVSVGRGTIYLSELTGEGNNSISALNLKTGKELWRMPISEDQRSPIVIEGSALYITSGSALYIFNAEDGSLIREHTLPAFMHSEMGLPDHVFSKGERVIVARETGLATFSADSPEAVYARYIEGTAMYSYYVSSQRYLMRQLGRNGTGGGFDHQGLTRELQNQVIRSNTGMDPALAQTAPRTANQAQTEATMAAASMTSSIVSAGISFREAAVAENMSINMREINAAISCHTFSIQGDYYIRPFYREGWGLTLIRLEDGARSDLRVSPDSAPFIINSGNFPLYLIDQEAGTVLVNGLGRSQAEEDTFKKVGFGKDVFKVWPGIPPNWQLPYASLFSYSLEEMKFDSTQETLPDAPPVPDKKETALREAILSRDRNAVKLLLQEGADVNALDQIGWNALFYAAVIDDKKIAQLLIDKGGDATLRDPHHLLAYHYTFLTHGDNRSSMVFRSANLKQQKE